MRQRAFKVLCRLVIMGIVGILYGVWYQVTGWGLPCIFHLLTGLYCPGCGVTRMCLALLAGDIRAALKYNAMVCCLLPLAGVIGISWSFRYIRTGKTKMVHWEEGLIGGMIIALVLFGIIRNLS